MSGKGGRSRQGHRNWKACVFGASTIAALLVSTACSPGAAEGPGASNTSDRPSTPSTPTVTGPTSTPRPSVTPTTKPSPGSSSTGGNTAAACTKADLTISAESQEEKGAPVRHILLTATNTSGKACNVYRYPYVQLGGANSTVTDIKDSAEPGEPPTTLAPGKQAYAALLLNGPMDEAPAKTMTVALQGRGAGSSGGTPIDVALPGVDTLFYNDFARVTHWTTASGYALRFIMSS
ncbi:DUF4232 domain-containing protein [Streptomyces sp. NBC_00435]|uniref:DUF4232 domain-containing protein n=1 Tax=Streptomyces sp. NBC_00435 TaxID=2903649 RepID=UPI002E20723C